MPKLSVVIITQNEALNILRCIDSVAAFADEIVVVDSFSTDRTVELCESKGCRVFRHTFEGYGQQKQFASDLATNDWVLSLDADEIVSEDLKKEIQQILSKENISEAGFDIPFSLFYLGRILKYSGVGREFHLRLFDRKRGQFTRTEVHEGIEINGPPGKLKGKIIHYSYRDLEHHLQKINTYTTQAAEGYSREGRKFSKPWVALKFPVSFFVFYFIRLGILDGYPGFMWSFLAAFYGSYKVAKTIELQEKT